MVIPYREQQKNHTLEKYHGEKTIDELWHEHVGSRRIFGNNELVALRKLKERKILPWKKVYAMYLTSKHWRSLRLKVLKRDDFSCQQCSVKEKVMHVDHLEYRGFGKEKMEDLQTLCHNCHQMKSKFDLRESNV